MLVVHALAQAWSAAPDHDAKAVAAPPAEAVTHALEVLRCDEGRRADSRRRRAIAKLISRDWEGKHSTQVLSDLGVPEAAGKELWLRVIKSFPEDAFALYRHDEDWLEYAVLRHLTTSPDAVPRGAPHASDERGVAFAADPPSCWRPEAESTNEFVNPYVELRAHVSVDVIPAQVQTNVDAQTWNDCGRFWSPLDATTQAPLDGAYFTPKSWSSTTCKKPPGPFPVDASAPAPGTTYGINYLLEQFYAPLVIGDARFKNLLAIWTYRRNVTTADGTVVPAHHLDYRLGDCGNDTIEGALEGNIAGSDMTTVLDSGYIEVWSEGGRTHVASLKTAELSSRGANWLTQFNPALDELNDELGELACCLQ